MDSEKKPCEWCGELRVLHPTKVGKRGGRGLSKLPLFVNLCAKCKTKVQNMMEQGSK